MNNNTQSLMKKFALIGVVISILMLALSAYAWNQIPAGQELPVHWNAAGEVDRYGSKAEGLLLLPAISMGMFALLALIPKIEPRKLNIEQSAKAYLATGVILGGFMLLVHGTAVAAALGSTINTSVVVTAALGVLFIVIGNFMGKIRSNFMFGVRTPWTLSSELSWNKTHRLTGKLFMAWGVIMLILAFTGTAAQLLIYAVVGILGITVWSFVYSYLVWRNDPDVQQA